jgi:glycosyltransferase involved in cell wall biosynthesis
MKKLYFDANFSIENHRGMGRYINTFISVLSSEFNIDCVGLLQKNKFKKGFFSFGFRNYILWEQFSLSRVINKDKPDVMIYPYNTAPLFMSKTPYNVLILHDLIFQVPFTKIGFSKSIKQNVGKIYRRIVVPRAIKNCDVILTVSEYTKNEIIKLYKPNKEIIVIPNSIDSSNSINLYPITDEQKFILHVGGDAPHKNSISVIDAYSKLPAFLQMKYELKIVGVNDIKSRNHFSNKIHQSSCVGKISLENFISDFELLKLYKTAAVFVFPSFHEGFGIPLIEAMLHQVPIVCSNKSVMPEIVGELGLYFNPFDVIDQSKKIEKVLTDKKLRDELITSQNINIKRFQKKNVEVLMKAFIGDYILKNHKSNECG